MVDFRKLSQKQIASALGESDRTIRNWTKKGMPRNPDKTYDLPAVIKWMLLDAADDGTVPGLAGPDGGEKWLSLYRQERYLLTKMQREREEGQCYYVEEIASEWVKRMAEVSSGLDMLSYRLPPLLEGKDQDGMRYVIDGEVWKLKDTYCRIGKFCGTEAENEE